MSADESYYVIAHARYEVDCPGCTDVTTVENDPAGEDIECEGCGATLRIEETR